MQEPHCAHGAGTELYDGDGHFCCLSGQVGFQTEDGMVGCSDDDPNDLDATILNSISTAGL